MGLSFDKFVENVKSFTSNVQEKAPETLDGQLENIEKANKARINKGENTIGGKITYNKPRKGALNSSAAYTNAYAKQKAKKGGQTNHVDLRLTGTYTNQIKAERDGAIITTQSKDSDTEKSAALDKNYDDHIGLSVPDKKALLEQTAIKVGKLSVELLIEK